MFNVDGVYAACMLLLISCCVLFGGIGLGIGYWIWG